MNIVNLSARLLTQTAITALKSAYDQCSDKAARDSIITAFKAMIQLDHDLESQHRQDKASKIDLEYDPSEYCTAV